MGEMVRIPWNSRCPTDKAIAMPRAKGIFTWSDARIFWTVTEHWVLQNHMVDHDVPNLLII